jgi:hypothetical protein
MTDLRNKSWKPENVGSFNMGWRDISNFYSLLPLRIKSCQPMLKLPTNYGFMNYFLISN